ncbi:hypothetical protein [Xylella fastidiosa]|nr:hypothetical protein [Xylella fastidiosa]
MTTCIVFLNAKVGKEQTITGTAKLFFEDFKLKHKAFQKILSAGCLLAT